MRPAVKTAAVGMIALSVMFMGLGFAAADHTNEDFFDFVVSANINDDPAPKLQDPRAVGTFRYERHLTTPTLDAPAGWVDGDRNGYSCGYAFLAYRGFIVGRVTFSRIDPPDTTPYTVVSDTFMGEGVRNYDGTLNRYDVPAGGGEPRPAPGMSCPFPLAKSYDPLVGDPGPTPVVTYQHGPHTIEVRDFADEADVKNVGSGHTFKVVSESDTRMEIIAYQDGTPALAIYYDLMTTAIIPGTEHPVAMLSSTPGEQEPQPGPSPEPSPEGEPSPEPSSAPSPEISTEPPPEPGVRGDLNGDGRVNFADLLILVDHWTG
ncbi:MAG: hypothetical protein ACRDHV_02805 [Actinomycetota bacterium]